MLKDNINNSKKYKEFAVHLKHTVLYKLDSLNNFIPFNELFIDKWTNTHVRMPCSSLSFYPIVKDGKKTLTQRWKLINEALKVTPQNIYDIKKIILNYNSRFEEEWDFEALIQLFENELTVNECQHFFNIIYPGIVELTLNLPDLITEPLPLLQANINHAISLTQLQIASLLANAFFCTFPRRNSRNNVGEFKNYPNINFSSLFSLNKASSPIRKIEKLKCILNYFNRVVLERPDGVVTFTKRCVEEPLNWETNDSKLKEIDLQVDTGSIFSSCANSIKIDFANEFPGGGVLGNGCVQEEILFITHPELIVSCLFTEKLGDKETLLVQGVQKYSHHSGYSDSFQFQTSSLENESSLPERDSFGRLKNVISIMDAVYFHGNMKNQYKPQNIERESLKAYCGFYDSLPWEDTLPNIISTGNWGCGAFGGDFQMKFLIQIMVCASLGKNMIYYTFEDLQRKKDLNEMFQLLKNSNCTVGRLWTVLNQYYHHCDKLTLFEYLRDSLA